MKNILLFSLLVFCFTANAQRQKFKSITEKDGKIGIGTNVPDEKLTVKGTIHTQEVRVDLEGAVAPDYVFETYFKSPTISKKEYVFPSLDSVAKFIETYYHLPEIPSASTLNNEGIELKKFNLLLLQKLEELTLYTIEQQKEIKALQEKVKALQKS